VQLSAVQILCIDFKLGRVVNAVFFIWGDFPAPDFYVPAVRNTLSHFHRRCWQEEDFLLINKPHYIVYVK
jgi:hypothetical protein